jgi:glycosyltransferase involved in cell wall biosynthesis
MIDKESRKFISVVTPCRNEEGNMSELHRRITEVFKALPQYDYEMICIDNCSTDGTRAEIREICGRDPKFKAIFNVRNFGPVRSPWHGLLQGRGDAVIALCADLEDPPELIPEMLQKWEEGFKLVMGVKTGTDETGLIKHLRRAYYWLLNEISHVELTSGLTGFGLYDREVVDVLRDLNDPYPYVRGLIAELGWKLAPVPYHKPIRTRGVSKIKFMSLFDYALLGMVNHTKLPLRLATLLGMAVSGLSFFLAFYYLMRKLLFWEQFQAGLAPVLVGMFFLIGLLFLFLGLIGEYVGFIVTHVVRRPLVIEEERLNFKKPLPGDSPETKA